MEILAITQVETTIKNLIQFIHADDLANEMEKFERLFNEHEEDTSIIRIYNNKLQEYRWISLQKTVLNKNTNNQVCQYMYTIRDIHEHVLTEQNLKQQTIKAEQAYNHKSLFLANMSHEIRTPLNGIIGMLTILRDTNLSLDQQEYLGMVEECSFNLMTIINDILDYSKLEVGKITLEEKSLHLRDCIESTNDIIASKVYEKSIEYVNNVDPDIPNYIYCDGNRLKQILLNLLTNAIKFTDKGQILLNISGISYEEYLHYTKFENTAPSTEEIDTFYMKFDVTDTGCGIEEDDKHKLFKSFSQVDNRLTLKIYQGTGLGLVIAKELVDLMHGRIWLDWSEPAKGSKFSFVIRTKISRECKVEDPTTDAILHDVNVLIVDDNLKNRLSIAGLTTKWGMKPHLFSSGEEALHITKMIPFDIGLIDICMPKMDGHGFAAKLRDQTEFKNKSFPLVALSSLGEVKQSPFKAQILKPVKEQKLKQICIDLLKQNYKVKPKVQYVLPTSETNFLEDYINTNNLSQFKDNIRILVAEDIYVNQRVIVVFLNKLGFNNITVVEDGAKCLDKIYKNDYDILLLDIRMPVMNGEIVMNELSKFYIEHKQRRQPYVIAVTAYCLKEDKERYTKLGFDDYIPKPISFDNLQTCLNLFITKMLRE
jgi:signal transduction histidine kinase/DNA-binding response OmpR family regulator